MLAIRRFQTTDFPVYQLWFSDDWLNQALGPMDNDNSWLDALEDPGYLTFGAFEQGELVAVAGFQLPPDAETPLGMAELAVKPVLRGQGVGSKVLRQLLQLDELADFRQWIGFVSEHNPQALQFFIANGWSVSSKPDEAGMQAIYYSQSLNEAA